MSTMALDAKVFPYNQSRPTKHLLLGLQEACALGVPGLDQRLLIFNYGVIGTEREFAVLRRKIVVLPNSLQAFE